MKKKIVLVLLFMIPFFIIVACSASNSDQDPDDKATINSSESSIDMDQAGESFTEGELVNTDDNKHIANPSVEESESFAGESYELDTSRMIIHTAHLQIQVKDFGKTQHNIENKVSEYDGYVVESNVYRESDERISGHMTVRIPEKHFQKFLTDTEGQAVEVLERNVSGQDVTEQYVDLESRLKSKRAVEERLLTFMNKAEKTEDLLKISKDLATVQEDIEVIVGKMNYLDNQSAYSTIEISMHEDQIVIPELDNKDLDTWEKTKKQLATSLNFLLATGSGLIVFSIGNLPIIILLFIIGAVIYFRIKSRNKME
jgi:hypothetical protein